MKLTKPRATLFYIAIAALPALLLLLAAALLARPDLLQIRPGLAMSLSREENRALTYEAEIIPAMVPQSEDFDGRVVADEDGILIKRLIGNSWRGYMAVIDDPKRLFVGTPESFHEGGGGLRVSEMVEKYGAVLGVNGAGFYDGSGGGSGGTPEGLVILDGRLSWGSETLSYNIIGIDGEGALHVGPMTGGDCLKAGLRWAVSFGPVLIKDGEIQDFSMLYNNDTNPRTAIGQREDGAVVLLVLEGRQISTLGASFTKTAQLLLDAGCVNAANLDGGASTAMYYGDEPLFICGGINGPRRCATAILVSPSGQEARG